MSFLMKRENIYLNAHETKETTTDDEESFPNPNCITASITVETPKINLEVKNGK